MAKFFLAPLRLAVGWGLSPRLLGPVAMTMLVLLRLTIGFHFLTEGIEKYREGDWTAKPFFANARGPLAGQFRELVWDNDGGIRLDRDASMRTWALYRNQIANHFAFDEAQKRFAQENYSIAVKQYDYVLQLYGNDIEEFSFGLDRMKVLEGDKVRSGVASLGSQREEIRKDLSKKISPTLSAIDDIWANYEKSQNAVATPEQLQRQPTFPLVRPRNALMDTSLIDKIVPYFDMTIGWALLLGLFTPVAALAAAGFLGSVFLSSYPPLTGPTSSNYQMIECLACCVLASTGAGRFAGLDFFIHLMVRKVFGSTPPTRATL